MHADKPMDPSVQLVLDHGKYNQLVSKLNYLIVPHLDIVVAMSVVSLFLNSLSTPLGCIGMDPKVF